MDFDANSLFSELEALRDIVDALMRMSPEARDRLLTYAVAYCDAMDRPAAPLLGGP